MSDDESSDDIKTKNKKQNIESNFDSKSLGSEQNFEITQSDDEHQNNPVRAPIQ